MTNNIPEKFWFRLISQFASSAKMFYSILLNECVEGVIPEKMSEIGDAVVGGQSCKCRYWKNGVILFFGDKVLFCINGLLQYEETSDNSHRRAASVTLGKIKNMQLIDVNERKQLLPKDGDGLEVNVPDYKMWSSLNGKTHFSCKLGPKMLAQVLEILNELCIALFNGDLDKGIYSQNYFSQAVICPYCYGDSHVDVPSSPTDDRVIVSEETSLGSVYEKMISTLDYVQSKDTGCYGFDIQICILEAQKRGFVYCPNHGRLNLLYLAPDLVRFYIMLFKNHLSLTYRHVGTSLVNMLLAT